MIRYRIGTTLGVRTLAVATTCLLTGAVYAAGPDWEEGDMGTGDAGSLPDGAQTPLPPGGPFTGLSTITGKLDGKGFQGADFQDMYLIFIDVPTSFKASTFATDGGFTTFDTQLWLFKANERGLLANDGLSFDAQLLALSNDGSGAAVTTPGFYYLAISSVDSDPIDAANDFLFDQAVGGEISGPDGLGGGNPIADWSVPGDTVGEYRIALEGVLAAPAPAGLPVLVAAGLLGRRRRRSS